MSIRIRAACSQDLEALQRLMSGFGREEEAHRFYARKGYRITGYRFVKPLEAPAEIPAPARGFYADPTFS